MRLAEGRYIAFTTRATNLTPRHSHPFTDVIVRGLHSGVNTLASASSAGVPGNSFSG